MALLVVEEDRRLPKFPEREERSKSESGFLRSSSETMLGKSELYCLCKTKDPGQEGAERVEVGQAGNATSNPNSSNKIPTACFF